MLGEESFQRVKKRYGNRQLTTKQFIIKSMKLFGKKFDYSKTTYSGKYSDLIVTCPRHGDIKIQPWSHYQNHYGCLQCSYEIPREIKKQKILEIAAKVHRNYYDYSKVVFVNSSDKVEIICPKHGPFRQSLYEHSARGSKCPECARDDDRITLDDFLVRSRGMNGDNYDYSKVSFTKVSDIVVITCKKHGDFKQRVASHLAGCICRKCFFDNLLLPTKEFIKNARQRHGDTYDYSKVKYLGNKIPVEIICKTHGSFWVKPNSHVSSGSGCWKCSESKGEKEIDVILKKYKINFIREYRIKPHLYRYDFYLPEFNIFIEFNGIQHYRPVEIFGGEKAFTELKQRDEDKKQIIKSLNGKLIILTYQMLDEKTVESTLIHYLKRLYPYWFVVNGTLKVYKNVLDIYSEFNVPLDVKISKLTSVISSTVKDFKVLF